MKRLLLATALAAFAASAAGTADARHDHDRGHRHHQVDQDYWKERRKAERRAIKDYEKAQKAWRKAAREEEKAYRRWVRGQYIPAEYRHARYRVHDHRAYGFAAPPAGYAYVRPYPYDDTYYLVELASGLISQILGD